MVINMEEKLSLKLVKLFRIYLKLIPMILAILYFVNTIISYFGIQIKLIAHSFVFLCISFIYLASYVLRFCEYHRMFLHYVVALYLLKCYDYYVGIPLNDFNLFIMYSCITFIALIVTLYLRLKRI